MIIAVTYDNEKIFQHFGHTEFFKIYNIVDGKIVTTSVVSTNGQGHGALSKVLFEQNVDTLICGGIGGGAINALKEYKITVFGGNSGSCDDAVEKFLSGNLAINSNPTCSHHDHDHGAGHTCGDHGCGSGTCGGHH